MRVSSGIRGSTSRALVQLDRAGDVQRRLHARRPGRHLRGNVVPIIHLSSIIIYFLKAKLSLTMLVSSWIKLLGH